MAIQHRRGNIGDFDPNKMVPGEWAFPSDGTARYCVSPGIVKTAATTEDVQSILNSSPQSYIALQQLLADLKNNPSELTNILNNITTLQSGKLDKIGNSQDNTVVFTEASILANVISGEKHSVILGKIMKFFNFIGTSTLTTTSKVIVGAINELVTSVGTKFNKSDIIQTTAVNDAAKVPSSAVTYSLAQSVATLNDNLAVVASSVTVANNITVSYQNVRKICKTVYIDIILNKADETAFTDTRTSLFTLPLGFRPKNGMATTVAASTAINNYRNRNVNFVIGTSGESFTDILTSVDIKEISISVAFCVL